MAIIHLRKLDLENWQSIIPRNILAKIWLFKIIYIYICESTKLFTQLVFVNNAFFNQFVALFCMRACMLTKRWRNG
jgi:hypothetical protein